MRSTTILITLIASLALAAPMDKRQNAGSTSTSTSNNNGLLNLGLTTSSASASEDGASTSSDAGTSCGKLTCTNYPPSVSNELMIGFLSQALSAAVAPPRQQDQTRLVQALQLLAVVNTSTMRRGGSIHLSPEVLLLSSRLFWGFTKHFNISVCNTSGRPCVYQ